MSLSEKPKIELLSPLSRNAMRLDSIGAVRREMARIYRLGLNGKLPSDEMTRFTYVLKELRACIEAEMLTDVQQRLALLSRDMDIQNGQRVLDQSTIPHA
jgi:hypothetical protein